jgi:hypothetical protein
VAAANAAQESIGTPVTGSGAANLLDVASKPPHLFAHIFQHVEVFPGLQPDVPPRNRRGHGNNAIEITYVDVR